VGALLTNSTVGGVTQGPLEGHGDEPAVVVQVTPRSYRTRAIGFITGGLLLIMIFVVGIVRYDRTPNDPILALAAIGYGVYCAVQARRQVTHTVLRIDRSGLHSGNGLYDHTWAGVVMVWVGSSSGLRLPIVLGPALHVFTQAGVDFAQRAGTPPKALHTIPVGGFRSVSDLCERLGRITDASIVDGTQVSRRDAAAALG